MESPKGHLWSLSQSILCSVVHRRRSCQCISWPCFLWKIHERIKYFFVARNGRITICNSPHGRIKHKLHNSNKVKTTEFKTTVEANFLLVDNSWEEQLRSYVRYHDLYLYALLLCHIRQGSSSCSAQLRISHCFTCWTWRLGPRTADSWNSTAKKKHISRATHWNIRFLL